MTALRKALRKLAEATPVHAVDAESPPAARAEEEGEVLTAPTAFTASLTPGPTQTTGLGGLWLSVLRRRAGRGDRAAARELAELEAYHARCNRGEVVIRPHPDEPARVEWNRIVRERAASEPPSPPRSDEPPQPPLRPSGGRVHSAKKPAPEQP